MMKKDEFLKSLDEKIYDSNEKNELMNYYNELIEDKIDNGMSEEEAIFSLGPIDDIIKKSNVKKKIIIDDNDKKAYIGGEKITDIIISILLWICVILGGFGIMSLLILSATIGLSGIGLFIISFFVIFDNIYYALLSLGVGLLLIGIAIILIPSLIKLMKILITECVNGIKKSLDVINKGEAR